MASEVRRHRRSGDPDRNEILSEAIRAHAAGEHAHALAQYTRLLAAFPDDAAGWTNLGALFRATGDLARALAAQRRAFSLDPQAATVRNNLANILDDTGGHAEAASIRLGLLSDDPRNKEQAALLIRSIRAGRGLEAALKTGHAAASRFPEDGEIRLQLAMTQLLAGDYAGGFRQYAARWHCAKMRLPDIPAPRWRGTPLNGKRLLVVHEQGFGDTLCAARFIPALERFGGRVSVLSRPQTVRLLQGMPGLQAVHAKPPPPRMVDCWAPIWDLAEFHFRDGLPLPPPAPLQVPAEARRKRRADLRPYAGKFRIGVVWTGSVTNDQNTMRSFDHARFLALTSVPGVQLVSLYKGPGLETFRNDGTAAFIPDLGSSDSDLADCAAAIAELDLVITSDTVTAHIAGSLGAEVWTLLHWDAFWLWGEDPQETAWYPSMRLFRQERPGDWDGVFARVQDALRERLEKASAR